MRSDRALSLYLFGPLARLLPQRGTRVPILMYHRVPDVDECRSHPYFCTSTAAPVFEQQMRFLRENGYRTVSVGEAFSAAQSARSNVKQKLVAITFDDGYRDFYTNAFPILNRYGHTATVFLPTAYIGESSRRFKDAACLTWSDVRELRKEGVAFGSHTVTHPQLRDVSPEQLREEVTRSKLHMEEKLGETIETFSYPYAFPEADREFVDTLSGALHQAGYREGVSTIVGRTSRSDNQFSMKRLPVNTHDDRRLFRAKLEGRYDWVRPFQYASKLSYRLLNARLRSVGSDLAAVLLSAGRFSGLRR